MNPPAIDIVKILDITIIKYNVCGLIVKNSNKKLYNRFPSKYPTIIPRAVPFAFSKKSTPIDKATPSKKQTTKLTLKNREEML
jgi:hypothetical protein